MTSTPAEVAHEERPVSRRKLIGKVASDKMDKAVAVAKEDFATLRAGRASVALFSKLHADYYGTPTPLNQMASFQVPEARMVVITPYDKSAMTPIETAIRNSDLGVNPTNDGSVIRVVFPQLTEERRKEIIKVARTKAEDAKVSLRNIRRHAKDVLDKMQKDGEAGEDDIDGVAPGWPSTGAPASATSMPAMKAPSASDRPRGRRWGANPNPSRYWMV